MAIVRTIVCLPTPSFRSRVAAIRKGVREVGTSKQARLGPQLPRVGFPPQSPRSDSLLSGRRSFTRCAVSSLRQVSVGEGAPLPRPRIQVVHGTVPQKCARNVLPAPSGILSRRALGELRCHPLPTSSTPAPEGTPN